MTPKSGTQKERYLISTVGVPPSSVLGPNRSLVEGNLELSAFEPAATNDSVGLQIVPSGTFPHDDSNEENKQIREFEDPQNPDNVAVVKVVDGGATLESSNVRSGRWTWMKADDPSKQRPQIIDASWRANGTITGLTGSWGNGAFSFMPFRSAAPVPVVGTDGKLRLFVLGHNPNYLTDVRIVCMTYDQHDGYGSPQTRFEQESYTNDLESYGLEYANGDNIAMQQIYTDDPKDRSPQLAACMVNGTIILAVAEYGSERDTNVKTPGRIHIFSYSEKLDAPDRFRLIKKDALRFDELFDTFKCEGGISLTYTNGRLLLAAGISEVNSLDATLVRRSVIVASSDDYSSWTVSTDAADAFSALATSQGAFSAVIGAQDIVPSHIADVHVAGDLIVACVSKKASLVLSTNGGKTWSIPTTPATALHAVDGFFRLTAVLVLSSEAHAKTAIYVGGSKGFLMRSLDGGASWKVLALPSDYSHVVEQANPTYVKVTPPNADTSGWAVDHALLPISQFDLDENGIVPERYNFMQIAGGDGGVTDDITAMAGAMVMYTDTTTGGPSSSSPTAPGTPAQTGVRPVIWVAGKSQIMLINQSDPTASLNRNTDVSLLWEPPGELSNAIINDMECLEGMTGDPIPQEKLTTASLLVVGLFEKCELIADKYLPYRPADRYSAVPKTLRIVNPLRTVKAARPGSFASGELYSTVAMRHASGSAALTSDTEPLLRVDVVYSKAAGGTFTAYVIGRNGYVGQWKPDQINIVPGATNGSIIPLSTDKGITDFSYCTQLSQIPTTRDVVEAIADLGVGGLDIVHNSDENDVVQTLWAVVQPQAINGNTALLRSDVTLDTNGIKGQLGAHWMSTTTAGLNPALIISASEDSAVVIGISQGTTLKIANIMSIMRTAPVFITTSRRETLLGAINMTKGYVEVWKLRSVLGKVPTFDLINDDERMRDLELTGTRTEGSRFIRCSMGGGNASTPIWQRTVTFVLPRPAFIETDEGLVALHAPYETVVASVSDTEAWLGNKEREFPFPITIIDEGSGFDDVGDVDTTGLKQRTLSTIAYGGMRLWAFYTKKTGGSVYVLCATARNWRAITTTHKRSSNEVYPPMLAKKQALGVGDIGILWPGTPAPGDMFSAVIRSPYPISNIVKESPSFYWRTGTVSDDDRASEGARTIGLVWDRCDPDIVAVLGAGTHWNVNSLALFGTNFPYAMWRISVPGFGGPTHTAADGTNDNTTSPWGDPNNYTEFNMNSVLDTGVAVPQASLFNIDGSNYATFGARIVDPGKHWPINYWASGLQEYYVMVSTNVAGITGPGQRNNIEIRRIIGNTADTLLLEGEPIFSPLNLSNNDQNAIYQAPCEYIIYTDRMFSDGTGGKRGTLYDRPMPALAGTEHEFGRYLMLIVGPLAQRPPEQYMRIGTAVFGRSVPVIVDTPSGKQTRHKFSKNWRWNVNTPVIEERFSNNMSMVRHIGKPMQTFTLDYEFVENWEMDVFYGLLFPNTRQAFAIQFTDDDLRSLHLVRLDGDVQIGHQGMGQFSHSITLQEVV